MKSAIVILTLLTFGVMGINQSIAQTKSSCVPQSCGPEGTKTGEAKVITTMRSDLQLVINKLPKSVSGSNKEVSKYEIAHGNTDDESLLYIYQSALLVRTELMSKVQPEKLLPALKETSLQPTSNKQQLVASLQKEIKLLSTQVERLQ